MQSRQNDEMIFDFSDIEHREFGFVYSGSFKRKMQFFEKDVLIKFIEMVRPKDCFVSVARYENPCKMEGWLGSDFFVDIDIESGEVGIVYDEALRTFNVLKSEFGLKNVILNKSGSKGYHVVVSDDEIQDLISGERQEIVDYLELRCKIKHIDTPCSCDIHRLRRLEGTINSKSGKTCKRLLPR
jgi:DNA primase catalytic subunit